MGESKWSDEVIELEKGERLDSNMYFQGNRIDPKSGIEGITAVGRRGSDAYKLGDGRKDAPSRVSVHAPIGVIGVENLMSFTPPALIDLPTKVAGVLSLRRYFSCSAIQTDRLHPYPPTPRL